MGLGQAYEKMNKAVREKNRLDKFGWKKQLVRPFRRQELWKCIGCILSEVTFGKKGHKLWGETQIFIGKKAQTKLHRDICLKTYLQRVRCVIYHPHYCYDFH